MRKRGLFSACLFGVVFGTTLTVQAYSGHPLSIQERTKASDLIAIATVEDTRAERFRNEYGDDLIVTRARVNWQEVLKGQVTRAGEIAVEGGTIDGITLHVSDQPEIKKGEKVVLFLTERRGEHRLLKRSEGLLKVVGQRVQGTKLTLADLRREVRRAGGRP